MSQPTTHNPQPDPGPGPPAPQGQATEEPEGRGRGKRQEEKAVTRSGGREGTGEAREGQVPARLIGAKVSGPLSPARASHRRARGKREGAEPRGEGSDKEWREGGKGRGQGEAGARSPNRGQCFWAPRSRKGKPQKGQREEGGGSAKRRRGRQGVEGGKGRARRGRGRCPLA